MNNWKSPVQKYVLTSIISLTLLTAALFLLSYELAILTHDAADCLC